MTLSLLSAKSKRSHDSPDEARMRPRHASKWGGSNATRSAGFNFEPGWRWSECVKPVVGTPSCQVGHLMHVVSGRMGVRMDDGSEVEFGPGDVGLVPPGHDAWIVGNESFVGIDFQGGAVYAKPG